MKCRYKKLNVPDIICEWTAKIINCHTHECTDWR